MSVGVKQCPHFGGQALNPKLQVLLGRYIAVISGTAGPSDAIFDSLDPLVAFQHDPVNVWNMGGVRFNLTKVGACLHYNIAQLANRCPKAFLVTTICTGFRSIRKFFNRFLKFGLELHGFDERIAQSLDCVRGSVGANSDRKSTRLNSSH